MSKLMFTLVCWLLLCAPALADILHLDSPGLTPYVRVFTSQTSSFAVALEEGSGSAVGRYRVTDAQILTAAGGTLAANSSPGYTYKVFVGAPSTTADDPLRGYGSLPWSGTAELPASAHTTFWAGTATASDDIAVLSQLASGNFADAFFTAAKFAANALTSDAIAPSAATELAAASSGTSVSAYLVDRDHTFRFDSRNQITASNDINEAVGSSNIIISMDFTEPMPALSSVFTVDSVTVADLAGETEPIIGAITVSADKKKADVILDAAAATDGDYVFSFKITTTDSQEFVRKGTLKLR